MWLVAGLGNPGDEYAHTRHNIGFMAIDRLAGSGAPFTRKFHGDVAQIQLGAEKCLLLKPQTYMNLSGKSVLAAASFFKIPPEKVIVLHDELDLPLGKLRIKKGGGANGHNGIKDIDAAIGPEYWRVRLGIGHPGAKEAVHSHVLSRFGAEEAPMLERVLKNFAELLPLFWEASPELLMSKFAAVMQE